MAAKFDKEMLKKHHFWFLFSIVFIGLLLAWIGLFWDVPEETVKTQEEQETKQKALKNVQAKPRLLISKYSEQVAELQVRRVNMWRQAWNEQKDLYFWPAKRPTSGNDPLAVLDPQRAFFLEEATNGFTEKQLAVVANLKFGADIPNKEGVRDQFRNPENYEAAYKKVIADLAPMQCRDNNWAAILKYVAKWGQVPTSEEVWLAMEDLWVQREILMRVHQVNLEAAKFASTSDLAASIAGQAAGQLIEKPNHRVFRSRLWKLDLQLVDDGKKRVFKGTLTNTTERLQVLGIGNVLKLKVWTNDPEKSNPYPLDIEGVSVPAGKVAEKNPLPIKPIASHELPSEWSARGIFRVEQIFDTRTVPVKRVEHLEIGKLSDRNNNLPIRMAAFSEAAAAKDPNVGTSSGSGGMGPVGPMGFGMEGMGGESQGAPALNPRTPQHQLNRMRYIDVTGQLRRIPIGLVVVTDQTYMKDIVESIANTKMRFQTTQVEWSRFHNTLYYRTENQGGGMARGGPGEGPMFGSGFNFSSGGPDNSSQDEFSANLMELSVYGIISLYEKYDEPKGGTPKLPGTPKDKEPAPPVKEKEKTPMPPIVKEKDPKISDPKDNKEPAPKAPANPKS